MCGGRVMAVIGGWEVSALINLVGLAGTTPHINRVIIVGRIHDQTLCPPAYKTRLLAGNTAQIRECGRVIGGGCRDGFVRACTSLSNLGEFEKEFLERKP